MSGHLFRDSYRASSREDVAATSDGELVVHGDGHDDRQP